MLTLQLAQHVGRREAVEGNFRDMYGASFGAERQCKPVEYVLELVEGEGAGGQEMVGEGTVGGGTAGEGMVGEGAGPGAGAGGAVREGAVREGAVRVISVREMCGGRALPFELPSEPSLPGRRAAWGYTNALQQPTNPLTYLLTFSEPPTNLLRTYSPTSNLLTYCPIYRPTY